MAARWQREGREMAARKELAGCVRVAVSAARHFGAPCACGGDMPHSRSFTYGECDWSCRLLHVCCVATCHATASFPATANTPHADAPHDTPAVTSLSCVPGCIPACPHLSVCLSVCRCQPTQPTNQPLTVTPVGRSQPASKQRARQLVRLHTKASN